MAQGESKMDGTDDLRTNSLLTSLNREHHRNINTKVQLLRAFHHIVSIQYAVFCRKKCPASTNSPSSLLSCVLLVFWLLKGTCATLKPHKIYQQNPKGIRAATVTIARQLEA